MKEKKSFDKMHPVTSVKQADKRNFCFIENYNSALTWSNHCRPCIEKMFENNNYIKIHLILHLLSRKPFKAYSSGVWQFHNFLLLHPSRQPPDQFKYWYTNQSRNLYSVQISPSNTFSQLQNWLSHNLFCIKVRKWGYWGLCFMFKSL